ncbi:tRNA epoxyqueuosine(34) reductase QueG [Lachnoclostridium phytofermentans]|uniref:DUF1730 domain-containing protein n=1 Tax=Lachnoclostridium phytofermentans (strain ATCC 700394 / DSM 18823 / ISDg) TaxID=357809 RepID=A9KIG0_LACP7|nr:tRNA epoxyqueuosine(34) reductase QueG [Lachnoclostridium phytofermentans]ABX42412.1 domain of unknown function DUF1730 [Lachnoclostridium phytofermentans ISDg]
MWKQQIEDYCKSLGLDTIGFIRSRRFVELIDFYEQRKEKNLQNEFEEKDIEKRIDPSLTMESGKTIISIAFPYYHDEEYKENGFSIYTKRNDYHKVLKSYLNKVCEYIESLGGKAECFVDSNALPERYIAYLAGVGFIGKNNMLITKKYGSYVFLGEVITDLEMDLEDVRTYHEIPKYIECGDCKLCYHECPTKSINQTKINPNICLSYLTQKKDLSDQEISLLKGNVFGCDYCQLKCPYNEEVETNVLDDFKTLSYMNEDMEIFASMDNKFFKDKISNTSCEWRGKNVIKRNAILRMHRENQDITKLRGDSPYINDYIERLLKKRDVKE